ncbi:MAG: YhdP family protein [Pseudomonadales bacterium]
MPVNSLSASIARKIWIAFVVVLMLLAVYVSIGRMVMPRLVDYQPQIEAQLSEQFGLQITAQSLLGEWQGLQPAVNLQGVTILPLTSAEQENTPSKSLLDVRQIVMKLDVISSLLTLQPVFSSLMLDGVKVDLHQDEQGKWFVPGLPTSDGTSDRNPLDWLLLQKQLLLSHIQLTLHPRNRSLKTLNIAEWGLRCGQSVCSSQGSVELMGQNDMALQFSLNIYERPRSPDFRVQGYLASPPLSLMEWLPLVAPHHPLFDDVELLTVGGEAWFEWAHQQIVDVQGTLNLPKITLQSDNEALASVDFLHTDFAWQLGAAEKDELWSLWLNDLTFKWAGKVFEPSQRRVSLLQQGDVRTVRLIADRIELAPLSNTLLALDSLPDKLKGALSSLDPRGQLVNVHLDYLLPDTEKSSSAISFKLQANLNEVAVSAWQNSPAASGVSGYLEAGPTAGRVAFESSDFQLHFPRIYKHGWKFDQASGEVSWSREKNILWLHGEKLALTSDIGKLTGQFGAMISKSGVEPRLSLLMGLEDSHLPGALTFVPDQILAPKAVEWLQQAFAGGEVKRTRLVLDQRLEKGASKISSSLALDVDAQQVDFSFHTDWPHLTEAEVSVQIVDKLVSVSANKAHFYDLELQNIRAEYFLQPGASRLKASADVRGELKQAWQTLTATPLQKNLFELADDFNFSGQMKGKLALDLPFSSLDKSDVQLDFSTKNAGLDIAPLNVSVADIDGDFSYSSQKGLVAPQFNANMFGFSAQATISSQQTEKGLSSELAMKGHVKVESLSPWVPKTVLSRLEGEADYQARLSFGRGGQSQLKVDSNLKGIAVALPVPFKKKAEQSSAFSFNSLLTAQPIHTLRYADLFGYSLKFKNKGYHSGNITIGSAQSRYETDAGILVKGSLPELDYSQWTQLVDSVQAGVVNTGSTPTKDASLISKIKNVQLDVTKFKFLDESYDKVKFTADQSDGDWQVVFDNTVARGMLNYYRASQKPLAVDFDYFYVPERQAGEAGGEQAANGESIDALSSIIPQQLPELDLRIKSLFLSSQPFGRWAFNIRPNNDGVTLENVDFELRGLQAKGVADWSYNEGIHSSEFRGEATIDNVAAMLEAWQKTPAIEGKKVRLQGQLNWPGSPADFSFLTMQGPLTLRAKQGRIVELQSLPLLGIFNFNTLSRRLRLDFSDLVKKGFSFDSIEGAFQFERGSVQLSSPLVIDGPSAKFKVEGQTDLINEQFDHDVIVVLPVTDNIPVIVSLAGFPQVGVPMYLFNRAFGSVFERFTSVNYTVSGSWEKPKVALSSFFDTANLTESKKAPPKRRNKR